MKKTFLCILLLFSLFAALAAQSSVPSDADSVDEDINEQYETFSWSPVPKAKQYGVTIEKWNEAQEIWTDFKEVKTDESTLEVLFTPGTYRVSICVYNFISLPTWTPPPTSAELTYKLKYTPITGVPTSYWGITLCSAPLCFRN